MAKENKKFVCRCKTTKKFYSMERNQAEAISNSDKLIKYKPPNGFGLSQERRQKFSEVGEVNKVSVQNNVGCKCSRSEKNLKRNQLGGCLCTENVSSSIEDSPPTSADDYSNKTESSKSVSSKSVDEEVSPKKAGEEILPKGEDEGVLSKCSEEKASFKSVDEKTIPPAHGSKESTLSAGCTCVETIFNKSSIASSGSAGERVSSRTADEKAIPLEFKKSSLPLACICVEAIQNKSSTLSNPKVESIEGVKSYQEIPSLINSSAEIVGDMKSSEVVPSPTSQSKQSVKSRGSNVELIEDVKSREVVPSSICQCIQSITRGGASPSKQIFEAVQDGVKTNNVSAPPEKSTNVYINKLKFLLQQEDVLMVSIQNLQEKENVLKENLKTFDDDSLFNELKDLDVFEVNEVVGVLKQRSQRLSESLGDRKVEKEQLEMNVDSSPQGENEMVTRRHLEIEMKKVQMDIPIKAKDDGNEIETLKQRLEDINDSVKNLSLISQKLKEDMTVLSCKCDEIHNDVILNKFPGNLESENVMDDIPENELEKIGRKFSSLILEVNACQNCCIPEDLIEIVKSIRDLVYIVNKFK